MKKISKFSGTYRFLSNFFPSQMLIDGEFYDTVEHAYQAAKTDDPEKKKEIREAFSAGKAKKLGQRAELVEGWEEKKFEVMERLVREKFKQNQKIAMELAATGDKQLIEGNTWGDTIWGVCGGVGENNLGKILMRVRDELNTQ